MSGDGNGDGRKADLVGLLAFEDLEYLFRFLLRRLHLRCLMVVVSSELWTLFVRVWSSLGGCHAVFSLSPPGRHVGN